MAEEKADFSERADDSFTGPTGRMFHIIRDGKIVKVSGSAFNALMGPLSRKGAVKDSGSLAPLPTE